MTTHPSGTTPVSPVGRRAVLTAAAWSVPAVSLTVATPAHAATSGEATSATLAQRRVQPGDTTTLTVRVVEAQGAAVSGRAVALTSSDPGVTATPSTGATDAQGIFTATIAVATGVAQGDYVISASNSSGTTSTTISVAGALLLTLATTRMRSDRSVNATVRLLDDQARPVSGAVLTFEGSGPIGFKDDSGRTDAQGTAANVLKGDGPGQPGQWTVSTATADGLEDAVSVTVVDALELSIATRQLEQGGTARATVASYNAAANPRAKRSVTISVTEVNEDGDAVASSQIKYPSTVTTGTDGQVTVDLVAKKSARPQTYTVTATAGTDRATATFAVLVPVVPVVMKVSPGVVPWGGTSQVTVTATNADRTPAAGAAVTLSSPSSDVTLSPLSGTTDDHGVFTAVATVSSAPSASGRRKVTATAGADTAAAEVWIDAIRQRVSLPPRPAKVVLTGSTLWVLDPVAGVLKAVDTSTNTLTRTVTLPSTCFSMGAASESNATRLYLFPEDGRVFVYDIAANAIVATLMRPNGGHEIIQISAHDSAGRVYAAAPRDGVVMVIDTAADTLLAEVSGIWPLAVVGGRGAYADRFYFVDGDGILHCVQTLDHTEVWKLDLHVSIDASALMAVSTNGERAFVATSGAVTVVDLVASAVLARIPIRGEEAAGIDRTPDGTRVLVLTKTPDTITAVSTSTNKVVAAWNPGPSALSLAVLSDTTAYTGDYDIDKPGVSIIDIR